MKLVLIAMLGLLLMALYWALMVRATDTRPTEQLPSPGSLQSSNPAYPELTSASEAQLPSLRAAPAAPQEKALVPEAKTTQGVESPWSLPDRLPSGKECLQHSDYNPLHRQFPLESRIELQRFIQARNVRYVEMIDQRAARLKAHISDKLHHRLYSEEKPKSGDCLVSTQEVISSAERRRVYVTICPGEFLDIDQMNVDLMAFLQGSVEEIQEYVRKM